MVQRVSQPQFGATTLDAFSATFVQLIDPKIQLAVGTLALSDKLTVSSRELSGQVDSPRGGAISTAILVTAVSDEDGGATVFTCVSSSLDTCRADLRALYAKPQL